MPLDAQLCQVYCAVKLIYGSLIQAANPTAYGTMMREQAAKRNKIKTTKGRTVLPDVAPKRLLSSFSRHGPNNELQVALIKAII